MIKTEPKYDTLLAEAVEQIAKKERQILNDFAKAYLASMSFNNTSQIAWFIQHLQLNQEVTDMGMKYWFTLREDNEQ
jgi:hypothetical protein